MLEIIGLFCLLGALALLFILSMIDLRYGILPNELVMGLAALAMVFHLCLIFRYLSISDMATGALIGGLLLFGIRTVASFFYDQDALGMGDVKLMGAAGLWLGPYYVLLALVAGAMAGIVHGIGSAARIKFKTGQWPDMSMLSLPAGPGFAIGMVLTGIWMFRDFPFLVW